jgi:hypothetical protein
MIFSENQFPLFGIMLSKNTLVAGAGPATAVYRQVVHSKSRGATRGEIISAILACLRSATLHVFDPDQ